MVSQVALVECNGDVQESFNQALNLIGGIGDLNHAERSVVVKVGVFNHKASRMNSPIVNVVSAIINGFNQASQIYIAESDNYKGTAFERLQMYRELFTERVVPFNLSNDTSTREVEIANEKMKFSSAFFKPNVIVSTHALRRYEKGARARKAPSSRISWA
ncbi:MAG: hypothetical protein JSV57_00510 [Candidatus Bathyarchaeota archaeon]|nr:MAG: hypothetical protein JSV57_00510 [Candidatus Bathyarchaeota archaeon]